MTPLGRASLRDDRDTSVIPSDIPKLFEQIHLNDAQSMTMQSNFTKKGIFYESDDVHTMLDCGPSMPTQQPMEERNPYRRSPDDELLETGYSDDMRFRPVSSGRLRQEFFGGIFFSYEQNTMSYLDGLGFAMLTAVFAAKTYGQIAELARQFGHDKVTLEQGMVQLIDVGLIALAGGRTDDVPEHDYFPSTRLGVDFLQVPYVVEIEGTHGCFRECAHCAYDASPSVDRSHELNTAQLCDIIDTLDKSGVCTVRFTGGDFLFRRDAVEILQHVDRTNLRYHLLSDTIAFSHSALNALRDLKRIEYIGSSIDGHNAETHDVWRGRGAFDALLERSRKIADTGVPLLLGATLSKHNFSKVQDIGRVACSVGATYFEIGFLTPIGRAERLAHCVLDGDEVREALALYLEGLRSGLYSPLQSHYFRRLDWADPFADMEDFIDDLPYMTEWPFSRMRVKPTGLTYTAGRLKATPLGFGTNLVTEDLRDIWYNSPNLAYLRSIGSGKRMHSLDCRKIPMDFRYD